MKNSGDTHEGIWILAVLSFVFAIGLVGAGLQFFSLSDLFRGTGGLPIVDPTTGTEGVIGSDVFLLVGVVLVGLGVFSYFLGRGLLKSKKWARIAKGVISSLVALVGLIMMFKSYITSGLAILAIGGLEIWYLFFKKSTKKHFKK